MHPQRDWGFTPIGCFILKIKAAYNLMVSFTALHISVLFQWSFWPDKLYVFLLSDVEVGDLKCVLCFECRLLTVVSRSDEFFSFLYHLICCCLSFTSVLWHFIHISSPFPLSVGILCDMTQARVTVWVWVKKIIQARKLQCKNRG